MANINYGTGPGTGDTLPTALMKLEARLAALEAGGIIAPTLGTLTLSGALQIGVATSGSIVGAHSGSSIASNIPGITVTALNYSGTPTGSAQTIANGLVETLVGATNTPYSSPIVVAPAQTPGYKIATGAIVACLV